MKKRIASLILAVVLSSTVAVYGSTDIPEILKILWIAWD